MANFIENLRSITPKIQPKQQVFIKSDPVREYAWQKANFSKMEEDTKSGKIKTSESQKREYDTVADMDDIYSRISNDFQNYFYEKYRDSMATDEVPDDVIEKESADFLKKEIESKKLNSREFPNGKTFIENFRKYGYEENLLPDQDKISTHPRYERRLGEIPYRNVDGNWITGRRLKILFPFGTKTPRINKDSLKKNQGMV